VAVTLPTKDERRRTKIEGYTEGAMKELAEIKRALEAEKP
jgi:hypothetical protein